MSSEHVPPSWQCPVPALPDLVGRPRSFEHVSGQDDATAEIRSFIADALAPTSAKPPCQTLLVSGRSGVGKTTLLRILANTCLCWKRKEGYEACGTCLVCIAFRDDPPRGIDDYIEISAAEFAGVDAMSHLVALMRRSPLGQFKVGFADEAHRASRAGKDALLKDLEEPAPHAIYILATTDPDKLGPALLTRCRHIRLRGASTADHLRFLRRRCETGWGLGPDAYEPAALECLAARAGTSYRELAAALDRCVTAGPLTTATVGSLFPNPLAACLRCAEAILDDDLSGAIAALMEAPGSPDEKRAAMQRFLLGLSLSHARHIGQAYHSVNDLPTERLAVLAGRFDARRPRTTSLAAYLEDCARVWGPSR
ncbi:AAA family ATPase [Methylobacterium sp. A49B]